MHAPNEYTSKTQLYTLHVVAIALHVISGTLGAIVVDAKDANVSVYSTLVTFVADS